MKKLNGAAKRINGTLQHMLSSMARFGESRHQAKEQAREEYLRIHGSLKGYNPAKADGIFSIGTMETYRKVMVIFAIYLADHGVKNASQITRKLAGTFLQNRDASGLSAWTVSRDMAAINKVFNYNFTKKELGLKSRRKKDIKNSRNGPNPQNPQKSKYYDAILFTKATGIRLGSVTKVTANHCFRNKKGQVICVWVKEKGGKERLAPVLNSYKDIITEIVNRLGDGDNRLFDKAGKHVSWQHFRAEYCTALREQLIEEYNNGTPFFGGELPSANYIHLRGKDKNCGKFIRGFPTLAVAATSGAMGHNRLSVMFSNYDYAAKSAIKTFVENDIPH